MADGVLEFERVMVESRTDEADFGQKIDLVEPPFRQLVAWFEKFQFLKFLHFSHFF